MKKKVLWIFLYRVFSGDKERVSSYIPNTGRNAEHEEVTDMLNLVEYAEENGMKKGRKRVQNIIPIKKSSISGRLFNGKELENVEKCRTYHIACRTSSGYHKKAVGMHA